MPVSASGRPEVARWTGSTLRREAFFFPSQGQQLYGAVYRARVLSWPAGVLVCPSWGVEADRSNMLVHGLAHEVAARGGAAFIFHYPGYGDSQGSLAEATMDSLLAVVVDAVAEARRRISDTSWTLAGFTFGGSVAALACGPAAVRSLLLLQPELRPGSYFREIARKAERASFGAELERLAFGYPVPEGIFGRADAIDAEMTSALHAFEGDGAAVSYSRPESGRLNPQTPLTQIVLDGAWRFGARSQPGMKEAALAWLEDRTPHLEAGVGG